MAAWLGYIVTEWSGSGVVWSGILLCQMPPIELIRGYYDGLMKSMRAGIFIYNNSRIKIVSESKRNEIEYYRCRSSCILNQMSSVTPKNSAESWSWLIIMPLHHPPSSIVEKWFQIYGWTHNAVCVRASVECKASSSDVIFDGGQQRWHGLAYLHSNCVCFIERFFFFFFFFFYIVKALRILIAQKQ